MTTINQQLNLVVPLERPTGRIYVHSMPIRYEIFEKYFLILSKTYAAFTTQSLSIFGGPRVAAMLLRQEAQTTIRHLGTGTTWWDGEDGVEKGLMAEIRRLSNVITPAEGGGWAVSPLQEALDKNFLNHEEVGEALNQITFFIVCSRTAPPGDREPLIKGAATMSNALTTLLDCTEYANSLKTSTKADDTEKKEIPSSPPPSPGQPESDGPISSAPKVIASVTSAQLRRTGNVIR